MHMDSGDADVILVIRILSVMYTYKSNWHKKSAPSIDVLTLACVNNYEKSRGILISKAIYSIPNVSMRVPFVCL